MIIIAAIAVVWVVAAVGAAVVLGRAIATADRRDEELGGLFL